MGLSPPCRTLVAVRAPVDGADVALVAVLGGQPGLRGARFVVGHGFVECRVQTLEGGQNGVLKGLFSFSP